MVLNCSGNANRPELSRTVPSRAEPYRTVPCSGKVPIVSQISQAPPPIRHYDLLIHVTCTSLITQSNQHYKGTHPTPALCPILIIRSGLSTATCYMLHATCYMLHATCYMLHATCYMLHATCLFRNLPPVPPPRGFLYLPCLSPLVCQRAAIDLGCVLLLVIHEFLARQVPSVYPLLSRQTTKSHTHHFSLLPQLLNQ